MVWQLFRVCLLKNVEKRFFCQKQDCRYISVIVEIYGREIQIHNFYVPAGGMCLMLMSMKNFAINLIF